jgi:hypothetical protein
MQNIKHKILSPNIRPANNPYFGKVQTKGYGIQCLFHQ